MNFIISGTDLVPLALPGGISWKRVNVTGKNSMVMQDATLIEDVIAARYEWSFKFRPMTAAQQAALLTLLDPRKVTVTFTDPQTNASATADYYVSDVPSGYLIRRTDGTEYWGGISATFTSKPGLVSV